MAKVSKLLPPGPKRSPALDTLFGYSAEGLAELQRIARDYGDISCVSQGRNPRILLSHPDWITQLLVVQHSKFHKSELTQESLGDFLGEGMLTSEGDLWRRQRSLAQPAFRRSHIFRMIRSATHARRLACFDGPRPINSCRPRTPEARRA